MPAPLQKYYRNPPSPQKNLSPLLIKTDNAEYISYAELQVISLIYSLFPAFRDVQEKSPSAVVTITSTSSPLVMEMVNFEPSNKAALNFPDSGYSGRIEYIQRYAV